MKEKKAKAREYKEQHLFIITASLLIVILCFFRCNKNLIVEHPPAPILPDSIENTAFFYKSALYEYQPPALNKTPVRKDLPNGITLGLHSQDYSFDYGEMINEIKDTGAKWICIQFNIYQEGGYSSDTFNLTNDLYWAQLKTVLLQCQESGLKIMVNPLILLNNKNGQNWRGRIYPNSIENWFTNYTSILTSIALLCQEHQVSAMGVGSELCLLESETKKWNTLILAIRKTFDGLLTYSLNWDQLDIIKFYDQLDFVGVSSYFSISEHDDPSYESLRQNWEMVKRYILFHQHEVFNKPIVLTEIGYTSQNGTSTAPWNYTISDEVDLLEQKKCLEAFVETWKEEPFFCGALFYDWFGIGGAEDLGYTFKDKPALEIIEKWFD